MFEFACECLNNRHIKQTSPYSFVYPKCEIYDNANMYFIGIKNKQNYMGKVISQPVMMRVFEEAFYKAS